MLKLRYLNLTHISVLEHTPCFIHIQISVLHILLLFMTRTLDMIRIKDLNQMIVSRLTSNTYILHKNSLGPSINISYDTHFFHLIPKPINVFVILSIGTRHPR